MASPYSRDLTPVSSTTVTAGASALLSSLVTFDARLKALEIVPSSGVSANLFMGGAATSAKTAIPATGRRFPCNAGSAASLYLYGNGAVDVWQYV
jgi:hypothetical protein